MSQDNGLKPESRRSSTATEVAWIPRTKASTLLKLVDEQHRSHRISPGSNVFLEPLRTGPGNDDMGDEHAAIPDRLDPRLNPGADIGHAAGHEQAEPLKRVNPTRTIAPVTRVITKNICRVVMSISHSLTLDAPRFTSVS